MDNQPTTTTKQTTPPTSHLHSSGPRLNHILSRASYFELFSLVVNVNLKFVTKTLVKERSLGVEIPKPLFCRTEFIRPL